MSVGMNDVTSKVAYAYAKQSAFVVVALAFLTVTPTVAYLVVSTGSGGWAELLLLAADALLMAGGATMLYVVLTRRDLARINHACRRIVALLFLVQILVVAVVRLVPHVAGPHLTGEFALALFALAGLVAYPFPLRRGGAVLYDPDGVRALANGRAAALGSLLLLLFAGTRLLAGGDGFALRSLPVSPLVDAGLLEAVAFVASGLFLAMANGPRLPRVIESLLVVALAVSLLLVVEDPTDPRIWAVALGPVALVASELLADHGLAGRLDSGRAIVAHRA